MKNQVKRWTAFALVMAMIFSVMTPVFAGGPYTVTVQGPSTLKDRTVNAYLLIEGDAENAKLTTLAKSFFTANSNEMLTKYGFQSTDEVITGLSSLSSAQLQLLTEDLKKFLKDNTADRANTGQFAVTTTTGEASATLTLADGYYVFVVPDETDKLVVAAILADVDGTMTIGMKSDEPPLEKTVLDEGEDLTSTNDDTYEHSKETVAGQIHTFKLETVVPYVDEEKLGKVAGVEATYSFAFVDELTKGLVMVDATQSNAEVSMDKLTDSMIKLYLGDELKTNDNNHTYYTVSKVDDITFRVDIVDLDLFLNENVGKTLKITYQAKVTDDAYADTAAGIVAENNAYLEYEHNGKIVTTSMDTVTLIDLTITIDKWSTTSTDAKVLNADGSASDTDVATSRGGGQYSLAGAEFILSREIEVAGDTEGSTKTVTQYYRYDSATKKAAWTTDKTQATTLVTGTDGQVKILGLETPSEEEPATYYLEETKAPNGGYQRFVTPLTLVITNKGAGSDARTPQLELTVDSQLTTSWTVSVQNEPEGWLPSTGSMGTYLFIAAGVALIIGATLLKKRPQSAK